MRKRIQRSVLAVSAVAVLGEASLLTAQTMRLSRAEPVERQLSAGETHTFELDLRSGQFLFLTVAQPGIDVVVRILDPEGEQLSEVDGPGIGGTEYVTLFTQGSGRHRVEIRPFLEAPESGSYIILVERLEPAAATPAGRVDQLFAAWDRESTPGAAIAVTRDGAIVQARGYGLANLEYDVPITPSTVFHVASVSKQFTAFAIAVLADRGQLSLDDDIRTYLPEVPDFGTTITIRHLIHHTSGLRDQWNLLALAGWRLDDVITRDQILRLVARQKELNFEPGDRYLYCNTGYTLLAEIVARVSGQSFPEWTARNIFEPLKMAHTHFHDDHQMIVPNRAYSYASDPQNRFRKSVLSYATVGATSLFTTVEDLAKWMDNLESGQVGGLEVARAMRSRGVLNNGDTLSYAFGLVIGEYRGLRTIGHSGGDAGFRSDVLLFPDQRFAVVVLSNLANFSPGAMTRQAAAVYLADAMRDPDRSRERTAAEPAPHPQPADIDLSVLDDFVGFYQLAPGMLVTVSRDGDRLFARTGNEGRVELIPESEARFFAPARNAYVVFERDGAGEVSRFTLQHGETETVAQRIEQWPPTAAQLAEYSGEYASEELGTTYAIASRDSVLVAEHARHDPIILTPSAPDAFDGSAWFFQEARFERDATGYITGLRVSSGRVRNVLFLRR